MRALPPARLADDEWERIASMLSLLPALSGRLSDHELVTVQESEDLAQVQGNAGDKA